MTTDMARRSPTVIGLGAVGHHVAVLLATHGVRRLQLVDDCIVQSADIAAAGYRAADIGRSKADAVLNACFEIEPLLLAAESIGEVPDDLSDFTGDLFCCDRPDVERLLAETRVDHTAFCAVVRTSMDIAEIFCESTQQELRRLLLRHPAGSIRTSPSLCDGTLAGSLVIRQYLRYLSGLPFGATATFDFRTGAYLAGISYD